METAYYLAAFATITSLCLAGNFHITVPLTPLPKVHSRKFVSVSNEIKASIGTTVPILAFIRYVVKY